MQKDNEQLREDYKSVRDQLERVVQEMRVGEATSDSLKAQAAALTREKESLARTLENSQTSLDAISTLQGEYYTKQKDNENQIRELTKALEQANFKVVQEQALVKQLEMQNESSMQKYQLAEEKRNKLEVAYNQVEGLLKGQKREAFEMVKLLEEEIGGLKLEVLKTNTDYIKAKEQIQEIQNEKDLILKENDEVHRICNDLQSLLNLTFESLNEKKAEQSEDKAIPKKRPKITVFYRQNSMNCKEKRHCLKKKRTTSKRAKLTLK